MVSVLFCEGRPCPATKIDGVFHTMLDKKYYRMAPDGTWKKLRIVAPSVKEAFSTI